MRFIFSETSNPILNDPKYNDYSKTFLTKEDLSNKDLVSAEIERIKKIIPSTQRSIIDETGRSVDKALFLSRLNDALRNISEQDIYSNVLKSEMISGTGLSTDYQIASNPEKSDAERKRKLASLQRLIRERQENLAELDGYVLRLLMGKPFTRFSNLQQKFIKIAKQPTEEEVLEPVEDYYDDLYEESEGSPNYGKILTHPEKHRNELSTEASTQTSKPKFKKI